MSSSHEDAAATRDARERGTVVPPPGDGEVQERASLGEVVAFAAEHVAGGALTAAGAYAFNTIKDKTKGGGSEPPSPPPSDDA